MDNINIIFAKPGKYRSHASVIIVKKEDVEAKTVFKVQAKKAQMFIKAEKATLAKVETKTKTTKPKE